MGLLSVSIWLPILAGTVLLHVISHYIYTAQYGV